MPVIFRQPKAEIDAQLSRIYVRPGEDVEAAVTIRPSEKFALRHCSIDLVCIETYYKSHSEGATTKHDRDLVRIIGPLLTNMDAQRGQEICAAVQLPVLQDAVPSIFGDPARIIWEVQILVDVFRGRDLNRTKGLIITGNPSDTSSRGRQESRFGQGILTLSMPEIMISTGDRVEGRLELQTRKEFSVKDIRVVLERAETALDSKANKTVAEIVLLGPERFAPNQLLQWPFSLNMPSGALPSVAVGHTSVIWKVKAIAACGLFSDLVVEQEIQVFNSR